MAAPGVIGVLTAADIPGENDVSPSHKHDEPIFAEGKVQFWGQPMFAVIAETRDAARRAAHLAKIDYRDLPFATNIRAAQASGGQLVTEPLKLERGDLEAGFAAAPPAASRAVSPLAGRTISISKARSLWRCPARMRMSPSIPPPSTPAKCN